MHSLMWLSVSFLPPRHLHLLFCCVLSIFGLEWLVLRAMFCAAIRRDSRNFLFFFHVCLLMESASNIPNCFVFDHSDFFIIYLFYSFLYISFFRFSLYIFCLYILIICIRVSISFSIFANGLMSSIFIRRSIFSRDLVNLLLLMPFLSIWLSGIIINNNGEKAFFWTITFWMFISAKVFPPAVNSTFKFLMTSVKNFMTFSDILYILFF